MKQAQAKRNLDKLTACSEGNGRVKPFEAAVTGKPEQDHYGDHLAERQAAVREPCLALLGGQQAAPAVRIELIAEVFI